MCWQVSPIVAQGGRPMESTIAWPEGTIMSQGGTTPTIEQLATRTVGRTSGSPRKGNFFTNAQMASGVVGSEE